MKILMLRGQVPTDRNPQEIVFEDIRKCDDMWTQLVFAMTHIEDQTELWYWGGERKHFFSPNFLERWVPSFDTYRNNFDPDVIFCRGGFPEYHSVLKRFPKAIKIYYGAGRRYLPQKGFSDYDIILQDSKEQLQESQRLFPKSLSTLFIKPAADNLFYPVPMEKSYDVCFPANGAQTFKGHKFVYSTVPSDIKLLNLGNNPRNYRYPPNVTSYRVLRPEMRKNINLCNVGIMASESEIDSCPRVIPEMLACGLPVVALDRVKFWREMYIVPGVTGELANTENFWDKVRYVLENIDSYSPRDYYLDKLSLRKASDFIREKINEVSI